MNAQPATTDQTPPRGAAAVNDGELEVGYDPTFESRWRHIEHGSHVFMILVVLAALAGLLGQGPLSHRTDKSGDGRLAVDFEPLARYGTTTQVTLHLSNSLPGARNELEPTTPVNVIVTSQLVEPMGLQRVFPQPARTAAVGADISYTFNIPPGKESAMIRFVLKPAVVGPVWLLARQGETTVAWKQWVLP